MQNVEVLHSLIKRMDAMDLFGQVYEEVSTRRASDYAVAVEQKREEAFLLDVIVGCRKAQSSSQVFSMVFNDPTGEGLNQRTDAAYVMGDPSALLMLPKIKQAAHSRANDTMKEYLQWLGRSHLGESDAVIAKETGKSAATIRVGRKRAVDFLIEVAHDLRHGGTTVDGELPKPLQMAVDLMGEERLDDAWRVLQACRVHHGDDPRWLNISGLILISWDRYDEAIALFREGMTLADDVTMRAKLLNNWGKALLNADRLDQAQAIYLRANRLVPDGAPPLLNLLAVASERRDLQDCRHYSNLLAKLLSSGKLSVAQKEVVMNRLSNNPLYDWVRRTDAWKAPSRWLRKWSAAAAMVLVAAAAFLAITIAPVNTAEASSPGMQTMSRKSNTVNHGINVSPSSQIKPGRTAQQSGNSDPVQGDKGEGWVKPKDDLLSLWWWLFAWLFGAG
mgnify:CR=1 FL=1